jgi:hypothetical protein
MYGQRSVFMFFDDRGNSGSSGKITGLGLGFPDDVIG